MFICLVYIVLVFVYFHVYLCISITNCALLKCVNVWHAHFFFEKLTVNINLLV